jgi:hypothetical protein
MACEDLLTHAMTPATYTTGGPTELYWPESAEFTGSSGTGVNNDCEVGRFWQFIRQTRVAVRVIDGDPVTYEVECDPTYVIPIDDEWSYYVFEFSLIRTRAQSTCCGFTETGVNIVVSVIQTDSTGSLTTPIGTWNWVGDASVTVTNNNCCKDGVSCSEAPGECDGTCSEAAP